MFSSGQWGSGAVPVTCRILYIIEDLGCKFLNLMAEFWLPPLMGPHWKKILQEGKVLSVSLLYATCIPIPTNNLNNLLMQSKK